MPPLSGAQGRPMDSGAADAICLRASIHTTQEAGASPQSQMRRRLPDPFSSLHFPVTHNSPILLS